MQNRNRDLRDYRKYKLSESDKGRGIKVGVWTAGGNPGTLIHQALESVGSNDWDEITLRAVNTSGSPVKLSILWGGGVEPDDLIEVTIPAESGFTDVVLEHILNDQATVRAYAATGDVIVLHGFVNRYEHSRNNY